MNRFPTTQTNLIARLHDAQDWHAWQDFVHVYEPVLLQLLRRRGVQDSDAQEIVQETFLAVSKNIYRFENKQTGGHFRAWLSRIARNLTVNYLSRQPIGARGRGDSDAAELMLELPVVSQELTDEFDLQQRREVFAVAAERVRSLVHPNTWQAFWLSCVENQPIEAVATQLGMSTGAVYVARSRVISRLQTTIKELGFLSL